MKIKHDPIVKQLKCGVRTEEGVTLSAAFVNSLSNFKSKNFSKLDKTIQDIERIYEELEEIFFYFFENEQNGTKKQESINLNEEEMLSDLSKLENLLLKSNISYRSLSDLLLAQEVFIKLGSLLLSAVLDVSESCRLLFYNCLTRIIGRNEFKLHNMAYAEEYKVLMKSPSNAPIKDEHKDLSLKLKILKRKNKVSVDYQKFHYKLLRFCLNRLDIDNFMEYERHFLANSLTRLYFRIPEFRDCLKVILNTSLDNIDKNVISKMMISPSDVNNFIKSRTSRDHFQVFDIFDWTGEFYVFLDQVKKSAKNRELLDEILN